MGGRRALVLAAALSGTLAPRGAFADDAATGTAGASVSADAGTGGDGAADGFGSSEAFLFSVERLFGFQSQKFCTGDSCTTIDSTGLQPVFSGTVGLFSQQSNGLNYGALIGFTYLSDLIEDDQEAAFVRFGPRIGYAGALQKNVGFWLRGGPSLFAAINDGDDSYALAASVEAMAVYTPTPRLGILFGPNVDIHIWGDAGDEDFEYRALGFSAGLLGVF